MRAIAILLAIVYHAGVPGFQGGYVGIEVFFVISGFVITGLLLREHERTGHTSLRSFYGRRVRRIMPAATLVLVVTVIAAYVLLGPLSGNQTANDGRWASVFLINIHFESNGTNYLAALLPPSLIENYWSLAVEEQFYIVYPTLFLLIAWWARKSNASFRQRLTVVLVVVIVASYAFAIGDTLTDASSAYFSLLTRAWELALGALIAVHGRHFQKIPQAWAAIASWAGLAAIMICAVTLTGSSRYPGALVAIPTLGAGLIIAAGAAEPTWGVERLLRRRTLPVSGCHLVPALSLALADPPVGRATPRRDKPAGVGQRGALARGGRPGHADLLLLRESHSAQQGSGHQALGQSGARGLSDRRRPSPSRPWQSISHPQAALATNIANLKTGDPCPSPTKQTVESLMGTGHHASPKTVARVLLIGDSTACTMVPGLEAVGAQAGVRIENGAVIGCGVVSGSVASTITDVVRSWQSVTDLPEPRQCGRGKSLAGGGSERRPVVELVGAQSAGGRERRPSARARCRLAAVVRRTGEACAAAGPAVHERRCHRRHVDATSLLREREPDEPDAQRRDFRAPQRLSDSIRGKNPARQDRRSRSLRLPFWTAVPDPGGRHRAARGWRALLARGLALGRPLAHASDRDPRPRQDGHRAPDDEECSYRRTGPPSKAPTALTALAAFNFGFSKVEFEITGNSLHNDVIGDAVHTNGLWSCSGTRRPYPTARTPCGASSLTRPAIRAPARPSPSRWRTSSKLRRRVSRQQALATCHHPERRDCRARILLGALGRPSEPRRSLRGSRGRSRNLPATPKTGAPSMIGRASPTEHGQLGRQVGPVPQRDTARVRHGHGVHGIVRGRDD